MTSSILIVCIVSSALIALKQIVNTENTYYCARRERLQAHHLRTQSLLLHVLGSLTLHTKSCNFGGLFTIIPDLVTLLYCSCTVSGCSWSFLISLTVGSGCLSFNILLFPMNFRLNLWLR